MRTQNKLRIRLSVIAVLLISTVIFSSCQKESYKTYESSPYSNVPVDGKTELVVINKGDWQLKDGQMQAVLPSTFYNSTEKYDYVKVFSKEYDDKKDDGSYRWKEMPNSIFTFSISNAIIKVKKQDNKNERSQFLIAIKLRK